MKDFLEHKNIVYILIILVLYTIIALLLNNVKFNKTEISKVDNYSVFYTLSNSLNTYLSYLGEDNENVYDLVEDKYREEFGITKENVISKLKDFDISAPSLRAEEMMHESVDKNIDKKEEILNLLPHYNCGACGFLNCADMASKILENKDNILKCKPMKNKEEVINKINDILK